MGNALGGRKKRAKVMKVDGTVLKVKPPARAVDVLRDHPGHALLDAERFQRVGLRGRPLDPDAALKPGKLYLLVELRRLRDGQRRGASCRAAWSGELRLGASERLESLRLSRRSLSDLSSRAPHVWPSAAAAAAAVESEEVAEDGTLRLKMRLPKSQVERLMRECKDPAEVARKILQLCAAKDDDDAASHRRRSTSVPDPPAEAGRKEKRTRFLAIPNVIIV